MKRRKFIKMSLSAAALAAVPSCVSKLPSSGQPGGALSEKSARSLKVGEGMIEPLGFDAAVPVFSWELPDGVKKQAAYRIRTKSEEKAWDSGWVESDQSVFVPYRGEPFGSRQRVEWRVDFRDEKGRESGWSKPAHFELGLLSTNDW